MCNFLLIVCPPPDYRVVGADFRLGWSDFCLGWSDTIMRSQRMILVQFVLIFVVVNIYGAVMVTPVPAALSDYHIAPMRCTSEDRGNSWH